MNDVSVGVVDANDETLALVASDVHSPEVDDGNNLPVQQVIFAVVVGQSRRRLATLFAKVYCQFVHVFPGFGKVRDISYRPHAHLDILQKLFGFNIGLVDSHTQTACCTEKTISVAQKIQPDALVPSGMRVAVGSLNPVKEAATAQALDAADIVTIDVDSGVPEQPRGRAETIAGAENRAAAALAATDCTYGVGIEGGVADVEGTDGLWLIMWAAVTDGERWGRGGGPTLRLPTTIADRIRDGEELGPVLDDHLDTDDIARNEGAVGVFTDGVSDRASALAAAVSAAAGPFVSDAY